MVNHVNKEFTNVSNAHQLMLKYMNVNNNVQQVYITKH